MAVEPTAASAGTATVNSTANRAKSEKPAETSLINDKGSSTADDQPAAAGNEPALTGPGEDAAARTEDGPEAESQPAANDPGVGLYCPRNHEDHSVLVKFHLRRCPECGQDLTKKPAPVKTTISDTSSSGFPSDSDSSLTSLESGPRRSRKKSGKSRSPNATEGIGRSIEYLDFEGDHLTTREWDGPGPFNLERDRQEILRKRLTSEGLETTLFKAVTILKTGVKNRWGKARHKDHQGILGDPGIFVDTVTVQFVIMSVPFIEALRQVATYDMDDILQGLPLEIPEPYDIIGHHLEQLQILTREKEKELETNQVRWAAVTVSDKEQMQAKSNKTEPDGAEVANAQIVTDPAARSTLSETVKHLKLGLQLIDEMMGDRIAQEVALNQRDPPLCTWRMLWLIFPPGSVVYVTEGDVTDACVVDAIDMGFNCFSRQYQRLKPCVLRLWHMEFNGQFLTRVCRYTSIDPFSEAKPINTLHVVPSRFQDSKDAGKLRAELTQRGEYWVQHLDGRQVDYSGDPGRPGEKKVEGRAYIDCAMYRELHGHGDDDEFTFSKARLSTAEFRRLALKEDLEEVEEKLRMRRISERIDLRLSTGADRLVDYRWNIENNNRWARYDKIELEISPINASVVLKSPPLESEGPNAYLLCPSKLKGFLFSTRTWETFDVRFCHRTIPNRDPFGKLVMSDERKNIIKGLVYKFTDPKFASTSQEQVWAADYIKGKGDGQIFLLHGGPGVGKSFTAECIAEYTGRPLLSLACGDIGTDNVTVEKRLQEWLKLAHKWGAVMLIDEADVFLEKRLLADIQRNSLVSVFLRQIEYYQGILFLTSNRVGAFDDAFISRIHVVLHFPDLTNEERQQIWDQFFDKLDKEKKGSVKIDASARSYVIRHAADKEWEWNGREIRNAFQTAVALAEYHFVIKPPHERVEGEVAVLEAKHFKSVCEMTIDFKKYLDDLNKANERQRAQIDKVRLAIVGALNK